NVSFYNQSKSGNEEVPVYPTPTIGMIGLVENKNKIATLDFKNVGDHIFLIGASANDIASSQYLVHVHGVANSPAPQFDLEEEYNVQQVVKDIIAQQLVQSVHDVSDGGLFISLIESAMHRNLGFDIMTDEEIRKDAFLFGESQSRIVVTVNEEQLDDF